MFAETLFATGEHEDIATRCSELASDSEERAAKITATLGARASSTGFLSTRERWHLAAALDS